MSIDEVVGQHEAWQRLMQMEQEDRLPHAMLITGPQGCGKMAMAMAFAAHLLNNSQLLKGFNHPDLHFTFPTIKPANSGADYKPVSDDYMAQWREMLTHGPYFTFEQWMTAMDAANQQAVITAAEADKLTRELSLKASQGGYKVSIIWLPERMNATSANKILKTLEEPPQRTIFLMVSEEPGLLLETILSRTQRFAMKRIDTADIEQALQQRRGLDADTAHAIARVAGGSWIKAIETLDTRNESHQFFDLFTLFMRLCYGRKVKELKKWAETVTAFGREKQKRMLTYFSRMVRESFMYNFRQPDLCYMTPEEEQFARKFSPFINEANVIEISNMFQLAIRDISQNVNSKVVFYDIALKNIVALIRKP